VTIYVRKNIVGFRDRLTSLTRPIHRDLTLSLGIRTSVEKVILQTNGSLRSMLTDMISQTEGRGLHLRGVTDFSSVI
jgi:hypothetical protein